MTKLSRVNQRIFADSAPSEEVVQFGSLITDTPLNTKDPAVIQQLANYLRGWEGALQSGSDVPSLEDFNALFFLITRQLAYLGQAGIAEYSSDQAYFISDVCREVGTRNIYVSLTDNNVGNALNSRHWERIGDLNSLGNIIHSRNATGDIVNSYIKERESEATDNTDVAVIEIDTDMMEVEISLQNNRLENHELDELLTSISGNEALLGQVSFISGGVSYSVIFSGEDSNVAPNGFTFNLVEIVDSNTRRARDLPTSPIHIFRPVDDPLNNLISGFDEESPIIIDSILNLTTGEIGDSDMRLPIIEPNSSDLEHDIDIRAGGNAKFRDSTGGNLIIAPLPETTIRIDGTADRDDGSNVIPNNSTLFVWAFLNPISQEVRYRFSTSNNNPTAPSAEFTHRAYLQGVQLDASGNIIDFFRIGRKTIYRTGVLFYNQNNPTVETANLTLPTPRINNIEAEVKSYAFTPGAVTFDILGTSHFRNLRYERSVSWVAFAYEKRAGAVAGLGQTGFNFVLPNSSAQIEHEFTSGGGTSITTLQHRVLSYIDYNIET